MTETQTKTKGIELKYPRLFYVERTDVTLVLADSPSDIDLELLGPFDPGSGNVEVREVETMEPGSAFYDVIPQYDSKSELLTDWGQWDRTGGEWFEKLQKVKEEAKERQWEIEVALGKLSEDEVTLLKNHFAPTFGPSGFW